MSCPVGTAPDDYEPCTACPSWPCAERRWVAAGRRVGLLSRRFRRLHRLTQRQLATRLGWSPATVGRMEVDAAWLPFGAVVSLLAELGYRVAFVDASDEDPLPSGAVTGPAARNRRQDPVLHGPEGIWRRAAS